MASSSSAPHFDLHDPTVKAVDQYYAPAYRGTNPTVVKKKNDKIAEAERCIATIVRAILEQLNKASKIRHDLSESVCPGIDVDTFSKWVILELQASNCDVDATGLQFRTIGDVASSSMERFKTITVTRKDKDT